MTDLVTIFGGSGFLGRYVARRMAQAGWRVRVACRHPNDAPFVRLYGVVGQVEPVFCNIRDDDSVRAVTRNSRAVVNCVGILAESGRQSFDGLQRAGAERIARIAAEEGVERLVQVSAIGAEAEGRSDYARTKAEGEQAVRDAFPDAVILRPSILFGHEDEFFNRFAAMSRRSPVVPLVGANTKFQPVYVDDVAHAIERAVLGKAEPGLYELGGPDVRTFRELIQEMLVIVRKRRLILGVPFWVGRIMGAIFGSLSRATGGLIAAPLTRDQVENLARDNVVGEGVKTFDDLGIAPTATEAVLPDYLWRFRTSGQYASIKESARNLRGSQE
ncbi:NADH dehydrogenase [Palleronia aestuarii]|uniref:NADH dehydrogenase n=1 Tax=Palleronia aestuarii TaxID=568105 RepID=A0A2W7MW27_9RHOB|nr:complex I NDUFA9 subunit family protein [Palleronia aestuarii]PZX11851.1 NADH dehydrogenase [Palleronia aestuarii]